MSDRDRFVERARRNIGVKTGDKYHKQIVDGYNRVNPKPVGYTATYQDDWCDIFVTWCADKENVSDLIGRECGVQRHKNIFQNKGIWIGRKKPVKGDIVVYDWQGYHANWADHIGIVERVSGNSVTVIEGNTGQPRQVKRRSIAWNSNVIVGYARPKWKGGSSNKPIKETPSKTTPPQKNQPVKSRPVIQGARHIKDESASFKVTIPVGIKVRNAPSTRAKHTGTLKVGQSINYDRVYEGNGYRWLSYIGNSGNRLYVPYRPINDIKNQWGTFS